MSERPYHKSLRLQNFTAFQDVTFEFVPGVNAFVGENGTGKTHVMKALYAWQLAKSREDLDLPIRQVLGETFQTQDPIQLTRLGVGDSTVAHMSGAYSSYTWEYHLNPVASPDSYLSRKYTEKVTRPVFIPAIDMMGHTRRFVEAYDEVRLDFDRTCRDIVNLMALERKNGKSTGSPFEDALVSLLGGELERDNEGRFYLVTKIGRLPMPLIGEGLRKIATLVQLQRNGWLTEGTTLFWDEPEVNLNPILMDEVIGALLALTRTGVQVFLATHSYVILKELDLQARKEDDVRYFGFQRSDAGTTVTATDDFALLEPNSILEQYDSLYDRELTRATGRNRNGERVR